jgi:hypothetical protein
MTEEPVQVPNRPTPLGRQLGAQMARLTESAWKKVKLIFPNHAEPGRSSAFRAGTFPNGCEITLMDAMKCVVEKKPFYCHQKLDRDGKPTELCAGWSIVTSATEGMPPLKAPYDFSE